MSSQVLLLDGSKTQGHVVVFKVKLDVSKSKGQVYESHDNVW